MFATEEFPDAHFNGREIPRVEYWPVRGLCNFVLDPVRGVEGAWVGKRRGLTQSGQTLAKDDVVSPLQHTLPPPPVLLWPPEQRDVR